MADRERPPLFYFHDRPIRTLGLFDLRACALGTPHRMMPFSTVPKTGFTMGLWGWTSGIPKPLRIFFEKGRRDSTEPPSGVSPHEFGT